VRLGWRYKSNPVWKTFCTEILGRVREESSMSNVKGAIRQPMVKPKRGRGSITDVHVGNGAESGEFIINNLPKIATRPGNRGVKVSSVLQNPIFPRCGFIREELVNEFHKQALVLKFQIFNTKPPIILTDTIVIPSNQALGTMANVITSPKKRPMTAIDGFDYCLRDGEGWS
jgi:hypothetical protein